MDRVVPVHYLRRNHAEWTPSTVLSIDTETYTISDGPRDVLALRCWAGHADDRGERHGAGTRQLRAVGDDGEQLCDWIETACRGRRSATLFAHNLSFDLVTTRLPLRLARRGWDITDAAVGGKAPWLRMGRGSTRLTVVDSWSYLPQRVEDIGARLGIAKLALPDETADTEQWLARCIADVTITHTAILQLLDWWDRNRLGRFTISGPATGWNAMRHIKAPQRVVIDPDPDGVAADRRAIYGGRRGVWRVGTLRNGPFLELDFASAYPSIAADVPLPMGRKQAFTSMPVDDWRVDHERWGVIAQCTIKTDVPRFPVKIDNLSWYPTGQFTTTLAGPEIAEARRLGCLLAIGPGHVHQLGVALIPWARWCLATQLGQHPDSPPAAQIAAKAWGRTVIGKWAAHAFEKIELGPAPTPDWGYEDGFDHASGHRGGMVDIAGRRWWVAQSGEADNSYPAVLAWVESAVRVRLSRVIEAVGAGAIVQADTDGLIVNEHIIGTRAAGGHLIAPAGMPDKARTAWVLNCLDPVLAPLLLRIKRTSQQVSIMGPQHLDAGGQRRLSGIPGDAETVDGITYTGKTWPGMQWQMTHGDARGYVRPTVNSVLKGSYVAGWVTTTGHVIPATLCRDADGPNVLQPWPATYGRRPSDRLTEGQHKSLDRLWR